MNHLTDADRAVAAAGLRYHAQQMYEGDSISRTHYQRLRRIADALDPQKALIPDDVIAVPA